MADERAVHRPRRRVFAHPGRVAIVALALLVVLNLGVLLVVTSDTGTADRRLPDFVQSVSPEPGEVATPQDAVSANLVAGRAGTLIVNGFEIPPDQLDRNESLGVVSFRPGPDKDFERWVPGDVTVTVVSWRAVEERPEDPDSYSWSFRAG